MGYGPQFTEEETEAKKSIYQSEKQHHQDWNRGISPSVWIHTK